MKHARPAGERIRTHWVVLPDPVSPTMTVIWLLVN